MAALDAAFRATTYRVETGESVFDLRIEESNPCFDDFLRSRGACCWGIITAHNPGGICSEDENKRRQALLLERVRTLGRAYFPACNLADDGTWPEEPGFLILQASEDEMCRLASEFSQLACVCGSVGFVPRLVWI